MPTEQLTNAEIRELTMRLDAMGPDRALNFEALDGFFCALAASPVFSLPSEFLPRIFLSNAGPATPDQPLEADQTTVLLLLKYWNEVSEDFTQNKVHIPFLLTDEPEVLARDWAQGYLYGISFHGPEWKELLDGKMKELFHILAAVSGDVEIPEDARESFWTGLPERTFMCASIAAQAYLDFTDTRAARTQERPDALLQETIPLASSTLMRASPKIGRNEPCPCESGRKYKHCCLS